MAEGRGGGGGGDDDSDDWVSAKIKGPFSFNDSDEEESDWVSSKIKGFSFGDDDEVLTGFLE